MSSISMNRIPETVLIKVFEYLDIKSKLKAERVCKEWKRLIDWTFSSKHSLLLKDLQMKPKKKKTYLKPFGIKTVHKLSAVYLEEFNLQNVNGISLQYFASKVISRFTGLKTLYLYFTKFPFMPNVFEMLCQNCCYDLQHLSLICNGNNKIVLKKEDVFHLCQSFPNLKVFQIEAVFLLIEEESVSAMITQWKNLEVFILEGILSNSEFALQSKHYNGFFFKKMSPNIKVLRLPGNLLNNNALQSLADKRLNRLEELRNYDFQNFTSIHIISDNFKSLKKLSLICFRKLMRERDAIKFFQSLPKLENLEELLINVETGSYDHSSDTVISYEAIKYLKDCKNLKKLEIAATKLTKDCIESIARFIPNLFELKLTFVSFKGDPNVCISPIQSMHDLKRLKLSAIRELNDHSMIDIIKSCNQLIHINVGFCNDITVKVLDAMIESVNTRPTDLVTIALPVKLRNKIIEMDERLPNNLIVKFKDEEEDEKFY